jgi:hypothetical protein
VVPTDDEFLKDKKRYFEVNAKILKTTLQNLNGTTKVNAYFDAIEMPRYELQKVILEALGD